MSETENNKRKFGAFGSSIFLHGLLLLAIATITLEATMPEGNVTGTIEFDAMAPQGQQLETVNVDAVAQPEVPDKVKAAPAPAKSVSLPPIKPVPVSETSSDDAIKDVDTSDSGTLPMLDSAKEKAKEEEPLPEQETAAEESQPEPSPEPKMMEPAKEETKANVVSELPTKNPGKEQTDVSGSDAANLKGQEKVLDQNYGTINGLPDSDIYLRHFPGNKMPSYPWMARLKRIEGTVIVHYYVNEKGELSNIQLIQSTNPVFNDEVMKAVKTWKFQTPVTASMYAKQFNFVLKGEAKEKPTLLRRK